LTLNAGNSGTLARLIASLLIRSPYKIKLIGDKSLSKRDFGRIIDPLSKFGAKFYPKNKKTLPLMIKYNKNPKEYFFFENKGSAQVKSAIMLAALNFKHTTQILAKKSRNHTENFFNFLNIPIKIQKGQKKDLIKVKGLEKIKPFNYKVPADVSSGLFFIALAILTKNSKLTLKNVNINFSRIGAIEILKKMGVNFVFKNKKKYKGEDVADILVKSPKKLIAINCSSKMNSRAIDEFLIIFLIAAKAKGTSYFKDIGELNQKESPRLKIGSDFLKMIGVKNYVTANSIKIVGQPNLYLSKNYEMKNFLKDHRVFMMSVIAALTLGGNWKIFDPDSFKTSFPSFLKLIRKMGGKYNVSKKL
jgi:3-phosphoshikimate 1-carboxyvinyltransferase